MMRPGRLNLLNVMNCAQTQQYTATFQKETWFCDFQYMNEQFIEVQSPDLTYLSNDFVVCWTAKCPISSLLVSHSSGAPSPTVESLFSRSFIHPRFQFPIHPMTWLVAQVTHLIHPRQPSHNSSQECFCYFIHFNPIHGLGAAGFGPGPIIGFFVVFSSCSIFLISAAWLFHSSVDIFLRSTLGNPGKVVEKKTPRLLSLIFL